MTAPPEKATLPPNYDQSQSATFVQHPLAYGQPQNVPASVPTVQYGGPPQPYPTQAGPPGPQQAYTGPSQPFIVQSAAPTPPYMAQTYIQPQVAGQPMQIVQPQTAIQMSTIGQPTSFQVVQQSTTETRSTKELNRATAILAGILFGITVLGLIIGPAVGNRWHYRYGIIPIMSIIGGVGLFLLLIAMILSCIVGFGKEGNKRGMLIGAVVMYCLALCMLVAWAGFGVHLGAWMLAFLIVGFGCLALAIMSGIACSRYSDNMIIMFANAPQPVIFGTAPQPVMGNLGQPVMGNIGQPLVMGNAQPIMMV